MSKSQMTISGRLLWTLAPSNNPMERVVAKNKQSGQVIIGKDGQPKQQTTFSLGIPKGSPQLQQLEELKKLEILKIYPGGQVPKNFAFKMIDGDTDVDDKGRLYSLREGHAGHVVMSFNAYFPVNWYQFDGVNYQEINSGVKVGDFVDVNFTIAAHGPSASGGAPGFYVEPKAILFKGIGDAIEKKVQTADPNKAFGNPSQTFAAPAQTQTTPAQTFQQPQGQQFNQQPQQQWQGQTTAAPAQFNQQPQGQPMQQQPAWNQQAPQQQMGQFQVGSQQPMNVAPAAPQGQQPNGQVAQPYYGGLPPQFQKQ